MKILFLTPHLKISGGVLVISTYAEELSNLGHEVIIASPHKIFWRRFILNIFKIKPKWLSKLRVRVVRVKDFSFKFLPKTDIVIVSAWSTAGLVAAYPLENRQKFYLIQHDERLYHGEPGLVSDTYSLPLHKIVVATWLKEMLVNDFKQSADLLLNSFDHEIFKPKPKPNDGLVRVLILDHSYEWKGTKEAVEMVEKLKTKYPNLRLMAFGARHKQPNSNYDEYYYQPAQSNLADIYSRADIFLCTSWDEGFGLPSLEAMACGTAVVTYDNGGSRDFTKDGESALVAPRQATDVLVNKLEQLIKDKDLRQKISLGGLTMAQNWPTWSEQALKLEKILKK